VESSRTTEERKAKDHLERTVVEEARKAGQTWKEFRAPAQKQSVLALLY
jgi:hypothetical protein